MVNKLITILDAMGQEEKEEFLVELSKSFNSTLPYSLVYQYQNDAKVGDYFVSFQGDPETYITKDIYYCEILKRKPGKAGLKVKVNGGIQKHLDITFIDGYLTPEQFRKAKSLNWPGINSFETVVSDSRKWAHHAAGFSYFPHWPDTKTGYEVIGYVK